MHKFMFGHIKMLRLLIVTGSIFFVNACSYIPWFGDDEEVVIALREPAELFDIVPEVRIQQNWQVSVGGSSDETRVLLHPHVFANKVAFTSTSGNLAVYDVTNGRSFYSTKAAKAISAGVGGNDDTLIIGTLDGDVIAINQADGTQLWSVNIASEVVAIAHAPVELAIIRTNDNRIIALSMATGERLWTVNQSSPALTLRGASVPLVIDDIIYSGMDNGKVIAIASDTGSVIWEARVSIPSGRSELDRLVDIDGQLSADSEHIYAASYHGRVAAISRINGRISWARDIPSVAGLSIDDTLVYVSDRDDNVWALEKDTGISVWKQEDLLYRQLSAPIVQNDIILVGDMEGYIHALAKQDGSLVGRTKFGKDLITASPFSTNNMTYMSDVNGRLASFTIMSVN